MSEMGGTLGSRLPVRMMSQRFVSSAGGTGEDCLCFYRHTLLPHGGAIVYTLHDVCRLENNCLPKNFKELCGRTTLPVELVKVLVEESSHY